MTDTTLRTRMLRGDILAGTFVKTPAHEWIEVLSLSGLDFLCLDAEHAPFDRGRMDACLAVGRALEVPVLVRIPAGTQSEILKALDAGASGIVVPHVDSPEKARNIAKWSRFGHGGRGFAGSTRWAGYGVNSMSQVLAMSAETIVIGQIEEPEGVDAIDEIAATEGLDGLFIGPADLAVCLGETDAGAPSVMAAMGKVADAAQRHQKACVTFAPNAARADELHALGVTMFFIASEQAFALGAARQAAADFHKLGGS